MIKAISISNFKSFSMGEEIKLAPITLIYGPNSSGKSSIIQAIMMLKQTIDKENGFGKLVTEGEHISLGSFTNVVHNHNESSEISLSLQYTASYKANEFKATKSYNMPFGNSETRNVNLVYNQINGDAILDRFSFNCANRVQYSVRRGRETSDGFLYSLDDSDALKIAIIKNNKITSDDGRSHIEINTNIATPFKIDAKINLPIINKSTASESLVSDFTSMIIDDVHDSLKNTKYLGPLRSAPKRFYTSSDEVNRKHDGIGNLGFDLYFSKNITESKINGYLRKFDIPYTLTTENIGNKQTGEIISIQLHDLRNNTIVTPKDVGFGIGQVLPIILDSVISVNQLIFVEQPEIHLHPRLQAHLADLFIDSSKTNNNQLIIETHSEALMLRIQRRIKEKLINHDMFSILYVDVGESGAQVMSLPLDENGDFTIHWPGGFFEERINETFWAM